MKTKGSFKVLSIVVVILVSIIMATICIIKPYNKNNESTIEEKGLVGEISFVSNRTDKKEELKNLVKEFEKLHPNVTVNLELIGEIEEILQRRAAVQELPDVTIVPGAIKSSEYDRYFLPIDDLGFDENEIYHYKYGINEEGKQYCLASSSLWYGIIYNKAIFEEIGIDQIPSTNEEFFEICEKIKSNGIVPMALNYTQSWVMECWISIAPYLLDNNLETDAILGNDNILYEDGGMLKSLDFVRSIVDKGYVEENILDYKWEQCKRDIVSGKVAMIFYNSDFKYQLSEMGMNSDDIGMFPLPESEVIKIFGDYKLAIAKNTKYPEVAKEFLKFLFEEDKYVNALNIQSSLKTSEKNKEFFNELKGFNISINKDEDEILDERTKDNTIDIHGIYENIRKSIGLDYTFTQRYIIDKNIENIITETNNDWNLKKKEYIID